MIHPAFQRALAPFAPVAPRPLYQVRADALKLLDEVQRRGGFAFTPDFKMVADWNDLDLQRWLQGAIDRREVRLADGEAEVVIDVTDLDCEHPPMSAPWEVSGTIELCGADYAYHARLVQHDVSNGRKCGRYQVGWERL